MKRKQRKRAVKHLKKLPPPKVHINNKYIEITVTLPLARLEWRAAKKLELV